MSVWAGTLDHFLRFPLQEVAIYYSPCSKRLSVSCLQVLVHGNCLSERIRVLEGDVEEVGCPDMVDVIVSEPMGYMLLSERLMGDFLRARKWLKPEGRHGGRPGRGFCGTRWLVLAALLLMFNLAPRFSISSLCRSDVSRPRRYSPGALQ